MDNNHLCPVCHRSFSQLGNMRRHLSTIHTVEHEEKKKFTCPTCNRSFTRKHDMNKHIEKFHGSDILPTNNHFVSMLISEIGDLKSKLEERDEKLKLELKEQLKQELQKRPSNNIVNNLNIVCVTDHDNYLDMLTDQMGDVEKAIEYIKDCALGDVSGDCKLLEKIYTVSNGTDNKSSLSFTIDKNKSTIHFYDEQKQECSEQKESFGHKLANNLQNSYLKGVNYLIQRNLDRKGDPNKFLDSYDVMTWNHHIYQLSELNHQKKIINQMRIPLKI